MPWKVKGRLKSFCHDQSWFAEYSKQCSVFDDVNCLKLGPKLTWIGKNPRNGIS